MDALESLMYTGCEVANLSGTPGLLMKHTIASIPHSICIGDIILGLENMYDPCASVRLRKLRTNNTSDQAD